MSDIEERMSNIAQTERELYDALQMLEEEYSEVFKHKKILDDKLKYVQEQKEEIKRELVENKDFDLHKVGNLKVSVSNIARVAVKDISQVSSEFKETKEVANEKKAQEYLKVMGEVPAGFEDKSYQRFSWKDGDLEA